MIESCRERLDRGEAVDFEAEIAARPRLATRLRPAFALLARLDRTFAAPPADSLVGGTLGPWRVLSRLGGGGMGEVFLCSREDGARAAVKVVHAHLLARPGYLERFRREARLGRATRHENVVATLDAADWESAGAMRHCLVMEYVEGRTLRQLADELGRVPEELCRHVGREIARGLAAIHAAGVVHRDLKPDNVIITKEHVVKVMDLGVARLVDEAARLSQSAAFVGSFHYAAPEQVRKGGKYVDHRVDLFALGLVLYELATGAHPFPDDDLRVVLRKLMDERPRPAAELNPQLSPFFEELVAKLLAKDPDARFASADEVARVLGEGEESAWWVVRAKALRTETRRPLRRIRIPRETALYGRDAELARLNSLFQRAAAGDGQVAVVEGEAGIGKSRLVDEFVGALAQSGEAVNFLYGSYPPGGAATASGAFSVAYREHLGDDEDAVRAALPQTPLLVPAFAALLRGDATPQGAEPLTKDSLQTVFVHATRSFAAERPTIVLIDDLHFAPEEGRALFASLALAAPGHRVLLIGCARPSLDAKWVRQIEGLPHATRLAIPRLSPKDLVLLLRDSLKSEHLAEELAGKIAVKSDGNPFFVFEILRGLREGQFLTRRPDGTWATTRLIAEIEVPSSVVELVQARVSDLGADDRNVLEVAACVGFEFDAALVGDVLRMERIPLLQRLGRIEKTHGLVRSAGRRFVFDHHQVMEVLYAGVSEPLREEYHAAIGTAIEARGGAAEREPNDLDGALCVDLAEHLLKGGQGPRALRYLDRALRHLETSYLNGASVRLANAALALPILTGVDRARLLGRLAKRLALLGRPVDEGSALEEAVALADAADDAGLRADARLQRGWFLCRSSRPNEAEPVLREAIALARASGHQLAHERSAGNLGLALLDLGRVDDAFASFKEQLALAQAVGDIEGMANATGCLGMVSWARGLAAEACGQFLRAGVLSQQAGDRKGEVHFLGNLGAALASLGRLGEARERQKESLALAREIGYRRGESIGMGNLGFVLDMLGLPADALVQFERSAALAREMDDRRHLANVLHSSGAARARIGDAEGAQRDLDAADAVAAEIGARDVAAHVAFERCLLAEEDSRRACDPEAIGAALALMRACGDRAALATMLATAACVQIERGCNDEARGLLDEAIVLAKETGTPGPLVLASAASCVATGTDRPGAAALLAQHGASLDAATAMRAHFLLFRATGDLSHLAEAKRRLDGIVANAPAERRSPAVRGVRLHRDIADAASRGGVGGPGPIGY